jgi:transcriptional regulator with XRE-family HTH domain
MPALNEQRQERRDDFNEVVGHNIRVLRNRKGIAPAEIAAAADIDYSKLYAVEAGQRSLSFYEACLLADCLEVSLEYLTKRKLAVR